MMVIIHKDKFLPNPQPGDARPGDWWCIGDECLHRNPWLQEYSVV
jgi:hypothetical protein